MHASISIAAGKFIGDWDARLGWSIIEGWAAAGVLAGPGAGFVPVQGQLLCLLCVVAYASTVGPAAVNDQEDISIPRTVQQGSNQSRGRLRSDVNEVLITASVTDPFQRPVLDLSKQNFRVFDDGVEQNISHLFMEDAPVSVGIVFDASNSMRKKLDNSRDALIHFLRLSTPGDEFSLWEFSDRPQPVCLFTTSAAEIEDGLLQIQSGGWTSLFDAMYLGLNQMKHAALATKALLILSDGGDNNSRYTARELIDVVREADVRVFSISILDRSPILKRISDESGGAYHVRKLEELPDAAARLSAEIHSRYVLGYCPGEAGNDGKYHKVIVKLALPAGSPPLHVAWRHGYYAHSH